MTQAERLGNFGPNAGYVLELYDLFQRAPELVDESSRAVFEQWSRDGQATGSSIPAGNVEKAIGVSCLAQAIRDYGHLAAHLDPLGTASPGDPALDMSSYGLTEEDLRQLPGTLIGGPASAVVNDAWDAIEALRFIYSGTTGHDYGHVRTAEERNWLRAAAELRRFRPPHQPVEPLPLLTRLTEVEAFELFLQRVFPGNIRFSLEGLDILVPMLDEIVREAAAAGIHNALLGMGHRGRLNVLAHVLAKKFDEILAEFKDPLEGRNFRDDLGWTGDVKYHMGASRAVKDGARLGLTVTLAPNPSHVEAVNPVIEGMARAAGSGIDRRGPARFDPTITLPVLIHGDAAFTGQGIVGETLNFSRVPGYETGGTIHIIANNQIGFTTIPQEMRSTLYASDLAKGFEIPVIHVNADDPEACIEAARIASAYRMEFNKDFVIDLIGYRRRGHNEADEPAFTQPIAYQKIKEHPTVRELWAKLLVSRALIDESSAQDLLSRRMEVLEQILDSLKPERSISEPVPEPPPPGAAKHVPTAVSQERLVALGKALWNAPNGFSPHPKIHRAMERRMQALESEPGTIDWPMAEELALGSLLEDGIAIRLTGEDTERGTFSQRHAVLHDVEMGETMIPLQLLPQAKAAFEVHNSPLSENAVVGFEYGYCIQKQGQLVIWEAQYGDFSNAAQVMIDEFLVSGRAKWGQEPSLVLLLPHGYEGQGPDHSSARLERLLQVAVDQNIRIASCTTAAQYFHLLRRQALLLDRDPLPLAVFTPKGLLRHPRVASSLQEFTDGAWQPVIDDEFAGRNPDGVRNLILCHGKMFVDLVSDARREANAHIAIVRIEQLYPYPSDEVDLVLLKYRGLQKVCWVQEEPENMGAWGYVRSHLHDRLRDDLPLCYVGRPLSASAAEGAGARHAITQKTIIEQAYSPEVVVAHSEAAWMEKEDSIR